MLAKALWDLKSTLPRWLVPATPMPAGVPVTANRCHFQVSATTCLVLQSLTALLTAAVYAKIGDVLAVGCATFL